MKWNQVRPKNYINFVFARHMARWYSTIIVKADTCTNCGATAIVRVCGSKRCQPCANHLITLWNEMRSEIDLK